MLRHTFSFVALVLISVFSLGLQSACHAQSVGGIFKVSLYNNPDVKVQVNAYYDATGAPTGSFYLGNNNWNFSGGYQYMTLGCGLGFGRDLKGNVYSSTGACYGTLFNYYYVGSRTKVMAYTTFSSFFGIGNFSVTMIDFTTKAPVLVYSGLNASAGWLTLAN